MTNNLGNKEIMAKNIKRLLDERGMTRTELCNALGFNYSTLADWLHARKYPRIDKIEMMANFFGVSKADLVEPSPSPAPEKPVLTDRDERDIQKKLSNILDGLDSEAGLAYYNGDEPMDEETRELLRLSLENSLRMAKLRAKERFTPKKYRKD